MGKAQWPSHPQGSINSKQLLERETRVELPASHAGSTGAQLARVTSMLGWAVMQPLESPTLL